MKFKLLSILSIFLIINACSSSNDETTGALAGTVSVDGSSTVFPVTEAVASPLESLLVLVAQEGVLKSFVLVK